MSVAGVPDSACRCAAAIRSLLNFNLTAGHDRTGFTVYRAVIVTIEPDVHTCPPAPQTE